MDQYQPQQQHHGSNVQQHTATVHHNADPQQQYSSSMAHHRQPPPIPPQPSASATASSAGHHHHLPTSRIPSSARGGGGPYGPGQPPPLPPPPLQMLPQHHHPHLQFSSSSSAAARQQQLHSSRPSLSFDDSQLLYGSSNNSGQQHHLHHQQHQKSREYHHSQQQSQQPNHHHHHHHHQYPQSEPQQTMYSQQQQHQHHHQGGNSFSASHSLHGNHVGGGGGSSATLQRRRRHSSTSRLKTLQQQQQGSTSRHHHGHHHGHHPPQHHSSSNFIANITNNFMSFGAPFLFDWRLFCERGQPRYVHKHDGDGLRVDECEARFLSKQIAEEEKASVNAISDEEGEGQSVSGGGRNSQLNNQRRSQRPAGNAAANVECLGSVRKSGFLSVKKWLIRKKTSLELARKRGWKGYWVCLKGTTLLFYRCDCGDRQSGGGHIIEARPRHLIFVDACLVQAIPEHPKRDYVFCLSTAFGDAYLLDAPCLVERDHWIAAIHCACAAQLARSSPRAVVSHVLHWEIRRLEEAVELDERARAESESIIATALAAGSMTASEAKQRQQTLLQAIHRLEEKVEKNRTEIFRFRAYLAALISDEDPNPKTLLSQTTKRSKMQLNRLGVFTVSSLHAFNCAKNPTIIGNLLARSRSTEEGLDQAAAAASATAAASSSAADPPPPPPYPSVKSPVLSSSFPVGHHLNQKEVRTAVTVKMLNGELASMEFNAGLSGDQVLGKLLPAPIARDYYLRRMNTAAAEEGAVKEGGPDNVAQEEGTAAAAAAQQDPSISTSKQKQVVFKRHETVLDHAGQTLEIVPKKMFTCEMARDCTEELFGFSVEAELVSDDLLVYVSRVEHGSLAAAQGLRRSDEIVVINGALVQDLDMMYVESVLQEELQLCLTIRSAREEGGGCSGSSRPSSRCTAANALWGSFGSSAVGGENFPGSAAAAAAAAAAADLLLDLPSTDELIESLVCPPPPPIDVSQMILSEKQLSKYIVPKVDNYLFSPTDASAGGGGSSKHRYGRGSFSGEVGRSSTIHRSKSKSGSKSSEHTPRPHSAAAVGSYKASSGGGGHHSGGHHHHHHHHGSGGQHHPVVKCTTPGPGGSAAGGASGASGPSGSLSGTGTGHCTQSGCTSTTRCHHHHHHHHHSSTKHIYHITDPQTHLYGLLEQHLLTQPPPAGGPVLAEEVIGGGGGGSGPATNITASTDPSLVAAMNVIGGDLGVSAAAAAAAAEPLSSLQPTGDDILQPTLITTEQTSTELQQQTIIDQTSTSASVIVDIQQQQQETITLSQQMADLSLQQQTAQSAAALQGDPNTSTISSCISYGPTEITNDKLRKVVHELLDTEITYCQALDQLMTLYLDPLLKSCTLSPSDARKLVGAIPQVIITQNQFREDLTTIINLDELNIEGIAKCFLNYCNDFKNYSTFCASHTKAVKLLADEKSILHEWLTKQTKVGGKGGQTGHPLNNMYSLESYLIRPIQRILKYPLLLAQIKTLCPRESPPFFKINEALRAIESVAEHINEMQRINEEYGSIFENLIASTTKSGGGGSKKTSVYVFDLTPISLIHYGGVDWLNSMEFLGKSFRKSTASSGGIHLHSMCFVFRQCVVFLCKETIRTGKHSKKGSSSNTTSDMEIIRHQVLIPVAEVQVRACPSASDHEADFRWELVQLKSNQQAGKRSEKIFRLGNSTNEYRNAFIRNIRMIIREDVRRMDVISSNSGARPVSTGRAETSPTGKRPVDGDGKSGGGKKTMVSFASTQNLSKCGYCGEDLSKLMKKGGL